MPSDYEQLLGAIAEKLTDALWWTKELRKLNNSFDERRLETAIIQAIEYAELIEEYND